MKRVIIVHGWSGSPKRDWIPWLTRELLARGYQVEALKMPMTYTPPMWLWMSHLRNKVGVIDEDTYFVGYSLGTRAIMLLMQSQENKAGGALLVGAFAGGWSYVSFPYGWLVGLGARIIIPRWLIKKVNYKKVRELLPRLTVMLSDNDPLIPFEKNKQAFKERLDPKLVVVSKKGHFMYEEIGESTPEILEEVLELLK